MEEMEEKKREFKSNFTHFDANFPSPMSATDATDEAAEVLDLTNSHLPNLDNTTISPRLKVH